MEFSLNIVPPGGGKVEINTFLSSNSIPRIGEYIIFRERNGVSAFQVRNVVYYYYPSFISVEVEYVEHHNQCERHKKKIDMYKERGKQPKIFPGY